MTWQDDALDGEELLSEAQRATVRRLQARTGRYRRDRIEPSNRDRWSGFGVAEQSDENDRWRHA